MDSVEGMENMDLSKLKVPELRKELKSRGLATSGNKNELMERLQGAVKNKIDDTAASVDDLDEDLLNDDDDEHLDESDVGLNDLDLPIETVPSIDMKITKRKSSEPTPSDHKQPKKIVLNRSSVSIDESDTNGSCTGTKIVEEKIAEVESNGGDEKKVIKLSELSAKERLEMRAKKFGTPLTGDAVKIVRAERFGDAKTSNSAASITNTVTAPTVDVLKSRAERFGVTTSTTLNKLENKEKLEKRKERFGEVAVTTKSPKTPITTTTNGTDSKAQQRLERFKQPVK